MRSLIGLTVLAVAAGAGRADEPAETITVTASATVFVKPDSARVHYTVRASESSMDAAKDAATKQVATVNEAIKALKFSSVTTTAGAVVYDRSSTRMARAGGFGGQVNPGANPAAAPGPTTVHYAIIPLTATLHEKEPERLLGTVDLFVKRVVELGGQVANEPVDPDFFGPGSGGGRSRLSSELPRIEWLVSDDTAARQGAYRAAVRKAKANAEAISKEIGWTTLKVVSVVDGAAQPRDAADPAPRAPAGEVAVTARVTLKCSR
jgi:uncharacterized protein YggE